MSQEGQFTVLLQKELMNVELRRLIFITTLIMVIGTVAYIYYNQLKRECDREVVFLRVFLIITNFAFLLLLILSPLLFGLLVGYYIELNYLSANDVTAPTGYTLGAAALIAAFLYISIYRLQQRSAASANIAADVAPATS